VITAQQAQKTIESLRMGIPPDGMVKHFTVGRASEIEKLSALLTHPQSRAMLIQANYGAGKTHLLRYIREVALQSSYAVSLITLDAKSGLAFNRLDQFLGQVCRQIEIPTSQGERGIRHLLHLARAVYNAHPADPSGFWSNVSSQNRWDYDHTEQLKSPALYLALRAWFLGDEQAHLVIEDWLYNPSHYSTQKAKLYQYLIGQLRNVFRDPRSERQIVTGGVLDFFKSGDFEKSWWALNDLNTLTQACGLQGLVILVDELEDIVDNIPRKADQQDAFWRLFEFFSGTKFGGLSFFAVTPDFVDACKTLLIKQNLFDFDYSRFEKLPVFKLSPLDEGDIQRLKQIIIQLHQETYDWTPDAQQLSAIGQNHSMPQHPDGIRWMIKHLLQTLDSVMENEF
jgi:hypothetical protein